MTIIDKINDNKSYLTKSEKLVADYILANPRDVSLYTITKIAEFSGVSKSAVLRFCQKLDYQGYSEFRYDMINYLHQIDQESTHHQSSITNSLELFSKSIQQLDTLDRASLDQMIQNILLSDQVYSIGIYKSGLIAQKLAYNLIDLGKETIVFKDMVAFNHLPYYLKDNSVLLIFSVSGTSAQLNDFLKSNKKLADQAYFITSNKRSATSKLVKNTLLINSNGLTNESIDPHAVYMVFVELLTQLYMEKSTANS